MIDLTNVPTAQGWSGSRYPRSSLSLSAPAAPVGSSGGRISALTPGATTTTPRTSATHSYTCTTYPHLEREQGACDAGGTCGVRGGSRTGLRVGSRVDQPGQVQTHRESRCALQGGAV